MLKTLSEFFERPLKSGFVIENRYQITGFLGKGSYGMTYYAVDKKTSERIVVKQLRKRKYKTSKQDFIKEAETLSTLSHPSIPKCLDFVQWEDKMFLMMELIEGKNFEELILGEGQIYDEKESLHFLLEVLKIVKYLHNHQLIHRDLRLPNILLKKDQLFIIDLGLSEFLNEKKNPTSKEKPGSLEKQLFRDLSVESDFYALGHFILFLLYSKFTPSSKKESSWEEELTLTNDTKQIIRKLLKLEACYENVDEIILNVENALKR
ncbi:protein kinase [Metabacillus herbersteinensis]|uniref:Protein kinase n=1 Tax=Metabacillus herbersteinensis TaxID=283816 RepID=A0ABV6GBI4_9BACI